MFCAQYIRTAGNYDEYISFNINCLVYFSVQSTHCDKFCVLENNLHSLLEAFKIRLMMNNNCWGNSNPPSYCRDIECLSDIDTKTGHHSSVTCKLWCLITKTDCKRELT